eukprot:GHVT01076094.1.p2 GENE.GHVT01076094.1~~GHVT01076094.1.p2  ORF type:complete len:121 (+),score=17.52 GHVT01076094.1:699-1061(+)
MIQCTYTTGLPRANPKLEIRLCTSWQPTEEPSADAISLPKPTTNRLEKRTLALGNRDAPGAVIAASVADVVITIDVSAAVAAAVSTVAIAAIAITIDVSAAVAAAGIAIVVSAAVAAACA